MGIIRLTPGNKKWWIKNGTTLKEIDNRFLPRYYEVYNKHLPLDEEKSVIEQINREHKSEIEERIPGSGKFITTSFPNSPLKNESVELVPVYQMITSDLRNLWQVCKNCGLSFWKIKPGQRYCNINCKKEGVKKSAILRVQKNRMKARIEKLGGSLLHTKVCEICGANFLSKRSDAKTCPKSACRMKKSRLKRISHD